MWDSREFWQIEIIIQKCEGEICTLDICVNIALWEGNANIFKRSHVACEQNIFIHVYLILIIKVSRCMFWMLLFTNIPSLSPYNIIICRETDKSRLGNNHGVFMCHIHQYKFVYTLHHCYIQKKKPI